MKKNVFKFVLIFSILCTTNALKAQSVITEFFAMNGNFYLDVKDKRIQKLVSNKTVLDIDWNEDKRILSISYPLGKTDIKDVVEVIKKVAETPFQPQKTEVKVPPVTPF
jgi:hypothetical protein